MMSASRDQPAKLVTGNNAGVHSICYTECFCCSIQHCLHVLCPPADTGSEGSKQASGCGTVCQYQCQGSHVVFEFLNPVSRGTS